MIVIIDHLSRMTVQYQVLLSMGSCNDVCNDLNDTLLSVSDYPCIPVVFTWWKTVCYVSNGPEGVYNKSAHLVAFLRRVSWSIILILILSFPSYYMVLLGKPFIYGVDSRQQVKLLYKPYWLRWLSAAHLAVSAVIDCNGECQNDNY